MELGQRYGLNLRRSPSNGRYQFSEAASMKFVLSFTQTSRGTLMTRCAVMTFFCAISWMVLHNEVKAQAIDDTRLRLRDISTLQITVAFLPEPSPDLPCTADRNGLEKRAAALLRAAGLQAVTGAETFARAREQLRLSQEDVRAVREGRLLPAPDAPERRRRAAESEFLQNISALVILFQATSMQVDGTTVCALAVDASFRARLAGRPTLAANGRQIQADMLLWERQARSFVAREDELVGAVTERLEMLLDAFLADWRRANGR